MQAVLAVGSGARAGVRLTLTADFATLGRHPSSDLQFDPEKDADVSGRHAAIFRQGPGYVIRDLGSTNGTWVNDHRIRSDRALESGDRIRLGPRGPLVEFLLEEVEERPPARVPEPPAPASAVLVTDVAAQPTPRAAPARPRSPVIGQEQSTTDLKIRVEVARQTDRLRRRLLAVFLLVVAALAAVATWLAWSARQHRLELARERERLLARVDSVERVLAGASEQASGLRAALDSARRDALALRQAIAARGTSSEAISTLDTEVLSTIARHEPLLRAARFDASEITRANQRSIVMVFVQKPDGGRVTATGFVARTKGDTGWVVTSRHALVDSAGAPPERIAVAFNGGRQAWRARLLALHDRADLALLRVLAWNQVFPVKAIGFEATVEAGQPAVLLGFPLGLDTQGDDWQRTGLRASTTTGTIAAVAPDRIQIDGYGASGASGSPVFGATGEVIGVLFGGERESGGRIVYAVPASALTAWASLRRDQASSPDPVP